MQSGDVTQRVLAVSQHARAVGNGISAACHSIGEHLVSPFSHKAAFYAVAVAERVMHHGAFLRIDLMRSATLRPFVIECVVANQEMPHHPLLIDDYGVAIGVDGLQMLFPVGGNRGKMPDDIAALLTLLHVWDLDLAEYVAMTRGVGGCGQRNLGEERNGCENGYN